MFSQYMQESLVRCLISLIFGHTCQPEVWKCIFTQLQDKWSCWKLFHVYLAKFIFLVFSLIQQIITTFLQCVRRVGPALTNWSQYLFCPPLRQTARTQRSSWSQSSWWSFLLTWYISSFLLNLFLSSLLSNFQMLSRVSQCFWNEPAKACTFLGTIFIDQFSRRLFCRLSIDPSSRDSIWSHAIYQCRHPKHCWSSSSLVRWRSLASPAEHTIATCESHVCHKRS